MKKLLLLLSILTCFTLPASATVPLNYVSVYGSLLRDASGNLVANATISFAPVNNNGAAISFEVGGGGQTISRPVTALVTNGVFTITLADTALTAPSNVCYTVTLKDNVSGASLLANGYNCVQPAGSGQAVTGSDKWCVGASGTNGGTCDFDDYVPNQTALVMVQTGPAGPANSLAIGTVTTLAAGAAATASIVGTPPSQTLSLGIPSGVPGSSLSYPGVTSDGANGLTSVGRYNSGTGYVVNDLNIAFPSVAAYKGSASTACNTAYYLVSMVSGSPILTFHSPYAATSAMVGMTAVVPGAGTGGAALIATVAAYGSASSLTLSANAVNATASTIPVSSDTMAAIGNSDVTTITAAVAAQPNSGGLLVPAGCMWDSGSPLSISQNGFTLAGFGPMTSFIVVASNTADGVDINPGTTTFVANPYVIQSVGIYGPSGPETGFPYVTQPPPPPYEIGFGVWASYLENITFNHTAINGFYNNLHTYQTNAAKCLQSNLGFGGVGWDMGQQSDSSSIDGCPIPRSLYWGVVAGDNGSRINNGPSIDHAEIERNGTCGITSDSKSITLHSLPVAGDTVTINGTVVTFEASGATGNEVNIGATPVATITALYTMLAASSDSNLVLSTYTKPYGDEVLLIPVSTSFVQTLTTSDATNVLIRTTCENPNMPTITATSGAGGALAFAITNAGSRLPSAPYILLGEGNSCTDGRTYGTVSGGVLTAVTSTVTCPSTTPLVVATYGGGLADLGAGSNGCNMNGYFEQDFNVDLMMGLPSDTSTEGPATGCNMHDLYFHSYTGTNDADKAILSYLQAYDVAQDHVFYEGGNYVTGIQNTGSASSYPGVTISGTNAYGLTALIDQLGNSFYTRSTSSNTTLSTPSSTASRFHQAPSGDGQNLDCWLATATSNAVSACVTYVDSTGQFHQASGTTSLYQLIVGAGGCSGCSSTSGFSHATGFCVGTFAANGSGSLLGLGLAPTTFYGSAANGSQPACSTTGAYASAAGVVMTQAGTLSNLTVRCGTSGISGADGVFTIYDAPNGASGAATTITVTYDSSVTANTVLQDTTHTATYAAGDLVGVAINTLSGTTLANCTASFQY